MGTRGRFALAAIAGALAVAPAAGATPAGVDPIVFPIPAPAYAETAHGIYPLGFYGPGHCSPLSGLDCDAVPAYLDSTRLPQLPLVPGETVRFHFGFAPEAVTLVVSDVRLALDASQEPSWVAEVGGPLMLVGRVGDERIGGWRYLANVVMTGNPAPGLAAPPGPSAPGALPPPPLTDEIRPEIAGFSAKTRRRQTVVSFKLSEPVVANIRIERAWPRRPPFRRDYPYITVRALAKVHLAAGRVTLRLGRLAPRRHRLQISLSDLAGNTNFVATPSFRVPR